MELKDAFLLGAGFSRALCPNMPTMQQLYDCLEPLVGQVDGFSREVYEYASGNVETLLSFYAIPSPHDDEMERLRKQRVTAFLEWHIGRILQDAEEQGVESRLNASGTELAIRWHSDQSHVLTTNYDTLIERIAGEKHFPTSSEKEDSIHYIDLYPIPITEAVTRDGTAIFGSGGTDTFTLYKLHGSISWYKSAPETNTDAIFGMSHTRFGEQRYQKYISDKRRFIVPPVYDKSSLLNHESIRNLWWQAKKYALEPAVHVYVIGYSLPETDAAMHSLLWEGSRRSNDSSNVKKSLYVIDSDTRVAEHYRRELGAYYEVSDEYAGGEQAFDNFVEDYLKR